MPRKIVAAAIQPMPKQTLRNPENVAHALELMEKAASLGAEFLCFPELYPWSGLEELLEKAKELGVYAIVGIAESSTKRFYNTAVLIGPDGREVGRQRKFHLLGSWIDFEPGEAVVEVFETDFGRVSMLICSDLLSLPQTATIAISKGADLIAHSAIPGGAIDRNWHPTLAHRCVVNYVPIVASTTARWNPIVERDGKVFMKLPPTGGGSCILIPPPASSISDVKNWLSKHRLEECIVAKAGEGEEVVVAEVDLEAISEAREKLMEEAPGWG